MKLYVVMPVVNCLQLTQEAVTSIGSPCNLILIDNASNDGTHEWGKQMLGTKLSRGGLFMYVRNNTPNSVAKSWNQGIRMAFEDPECEYVAVLNNDIVLHPKTLDHLMKFMDKSKYLMVTGDNIKDRMSIDVMLSMQLPEPYTDFDLWKIEGWRAEGPDFSCYMVNRDTIRVLGWFDENYEGAYCEDQDYHARCSMARNHIEKHNDQQIFSERVHFKRLSTAPYYHYASQTIARNLEIRHDISMQHGRNQGYYIRKFGGEHSWVMDGNGYKQPFGDATKNWRDW